MIEVDRVGTKGVPTLLGYFPQLERHMRMHKKQTMDLEAYIEEAFPQGLPYNEAAQLCLRLYCSVEGLPNQLHAQCSKDGLAEVFASLARRGFVTTAPQMAALYGANFHDVHDKGHWIEIIASIFKKGDTVDTSIGKALSDRLNNLV